MTDDEDTRPEREPRPGTPRAEMIQVKRRLDAAEHQLGELHDAGAAGIAAQVADLSDRLDRLTGRLANQPAPFHETDLRQRERARREVQVREWLDTVFRHYPPGAILLAKDCWWTEHPRVRWHVQAVWLAWIGAHRAGGRKHVDPVLWLEQHVHPLQTVLQEVLGDYRTPGCKTCTRAAEEGPRDEPR